MKKRIRFLIRSLEHNTNVLRLFVGLHNEGDVVGSCPKCEGRANLVKVMRVETDLVSHMAISCLVCGYFSGLLAVIKMEVR